MYVPPQVSAGPRTTERVLGGLCTSRRIRQSMCRVHTYLIHVCWNLIKPASPPQRECNRAESGHGLCHLITFIGIAASRNLLQEHVRERVHTRDSMLPSIKFSNPNLLSRGYSSPVGYQAALMDAFFWSCAGLTVLSGTRTCRQIGILCNPYNTD